MIGDQQHAAVDGDIFIAKHLQIEAAGGDDSAKALR